VVAEDMVMQSAPIREAFGPVPLGCGLDDPSHPFAPDEPVLAIHEIQGNILGGFSKDHQTLLCLRIDDAGEFKIWLQALIPFVATSAEVVAFNRLFKAVRSRRGTERNTIKATWINIAFSARGLQLLGADVAAFLDPAFKEGLAPRSASLGDPTSATAEGNPAKWVVGGTGDEVDVLVIVASDDRHDLSDEVDRLQNDLAGATPSSWRMAQPCPEHWPATSISASSTVSRSRESADGCRATLRMC